MAEQILLRDRRVAVKNLYSCHPILRGDHFRGLVLGQDRTIALGVADFLRGRPSGERPSDVAEISTDPVSDRAPPRSRLRLGGR